MDALSDERRQGLQGGRLSTERLKITQTSEKPRRASFDQSPTHWLSESGVSSKKKKKDWRDESGSIKWMNRHEGQKDE